MFKMLSFVAAFALSILIAFGARAGFGPIEKIERSPMSEALPLKKAESTVPSRYTKYAMKKLPMSSPKRQVRTPYRRTYGGTARSGSVRNSSVRSGRTYRSRSYGGFGK